MSENVIQIAPLHYIHVLDKNSNLTRLIGPGPQTFIRQEHEQTILQPTKMIVLTQLQYCEITNPIEIDPQTKEPVKTLFGQIKNRFGEKEIRIYEDYSSPFVLYPGEILSQKPTDQIIVLANQALKLKKIRDSQDGKKAGELFQIQGPFSYIPKVDEIIVEKVESSVIKTNESLKIMALQDLIDTNKIQRKAGEKWLVRQVGSYLPSVFEKVLEAVQAQILTDQVALHLKAKRNFIDVYSIPRKAGEEWLVTNKMTQSHIVDINEEKIKLSNAIVLSSTQYCVILNPYNPKTKTNSWGSKLLIKGECIFFLQPFEELQDDKILEATILGEDEALLLIAEEEFVDEEGKTRIPGEKWMVHGPREFITPIQVKILEYRQAIQLNEDEGVYIRNNNTGEVNKFMGQTVMLKEYESLWAKELPDEVEELLKNQHEDLPFAPVEIKKMQQKYERDKTKVIQYKVQKRRVLQLFNYKTKETRIIFGPALVTLEPDEQFTVLNLSGGAPKIENRQKAITIKLGPDFMSDILIVETSDHAQLSLSLTYNWEFMVKKADPEEASKLFSIKDFIGDACKQIGSRVRGAISQIPFENFHRNSSTIIQSAAFGKNELGEIKQSLHMKTNNLLITSIDIYNVEITNPQTREYLLRSINLAIEISTKSQEDKSKFQAWQLEEQAKGQLELQSLEYQAEWFKFIVILQLFSEKEKIKLYELEALCTAVKLLGQTLAEAKAQSKKLKIEGLFFLSLYSLIGEGQVNVAQLQTQAKQILFQNDLELLKQKQKNEYDYTKVIIDSTNEFQELVELEIKKARELSQIEINKITEIINAIGKETIVAIAKAGPEMKARLLKGLGIKGYLVTDGKNPINLFNTANGFMGTN